MCAPSPPPPPDYAGAAQAQGAANKETAIAQAIMSNPNIINPYGRQTVTYGESPGGGVNQGAYKTALDSWNSNPGTVTGYDEQGNPSYTKGAMPKMSDFLNPGGDVQQPTVTQTLTPGGQKLLDQQMRISSSVGDIGEAGLGRVGESMNRRLSVNSADELQNKAEAAYRSRLDPMWNEREAQTETQLVNQGLRPGMEAYDSAKRNFGQSRNDAYSQAILAGFQQRPQALQEEVAIRNQPLSELNALRTGAQPSIPQFQQYQGSPIAPPPLFQGAVAQGQGNQNAYNAAQAGNNSMMSGLFSLGSAGVGAYGALGAAGMAF